MLRKKDIQKIRELFQEELKNFPFTIKDSSQISELISLKKDSILLIELNEDFFKDKESIGNYAEHLKEYFNEKGVNNILIIPQNLVKFSTLDESELTEYIE